MAGSARLGLALVVTCLISCGGESASAPQDLIVESADPELAQALHGELDKRQIANTYDGNTIVRYARLDYDRVQSIIREVHSRDLPEGRTVSLREQDRLRVSQQFDKAQVHYQVKVRHGKTWIVWEEQDDAAAEKIIAAVVGRASDGGPVAK